MNRNLLGLFLLVLAVEMAVALVALLVWIPRRLDAMQPAASATEPPALVADRLAAVENRLAELSFALSEKQKKTGGDADAVAKARLKDVIDRLDDMATQTYDFERNMDRSLMLMQRNMLKRIGRGEAGAGSRYPLDDIAKLTEMVGKEGLTLDADAATIRMPARIATPNRPLELVAGSEGGPLHESLLEVFAKPSALRAALLGLGAKTGGAADRRLNRGPTGSPLYLYLRWDGLEKPIPLEDLILNRSTDSAMRNARWVFSGSDDDTNFRTGEDFYIPDESRVMIALTWNFTHLAVVSCDHEDAANEQVWMPDAERLPADSETPVELIVSTRPIG